MIEPVISVSSAGATASSIAAQMAAHEARIAECKVTMAQFNAKKSTVAEKQAYASCVEDVYPDPLNSSTVILFKVLFVAALIGMIVGIIKSRRDNIYMDWMDTVAYAFFGLVIPPLALLSIVGIYEGIIWLFN